MESFSFSPLGRLPDVPLPPTLLPRILSHLHELRLRQLRSQLRWSVSGFIATTAFTVWNWSAFNGELGSSSPFWGFIRLLKTDPDIAFASAREFATGLLESLPIGSLVVGLLFLFLGVILFVLLQSLREQRLNSLQQHLS